ncbi:XRE family transcriptional regulator [Saccharothrix sp. NPDC042600]|uniref:helix-turn-helix domain-containing protein n=1 Tax=Saccharothrix TaxID=2071 RepID=UPI00340DC425|nr:hypothetical protein GCM10017745_03320 [Saccharothrix mutabilis subsp. capreolus]
MAEDWSAVGKAIKARSRELGLRQRELAERSKISQAIVRELENHTVERRRSRRTLEALSVALEWHPGHLSAVLRGDTPLRPGETGNPTDEILSRLESIQDHLQDITERLDTMSSRLEAVAARTDEQPR